jgi:predicted DCC family thiol-disulfide oxidoreductase YuxK
MGVTTMEKSWLLWDGDCGFCRRSANWVKRRDGGARFEVIAYQKAPGPPMTPELAQACDRAVHLVDADGQTFRAGRAVLEVLIRMGWNWVRVFKWPPFIWAIEIGYWVVARNRRFFSRFMFRNETL